MAYRLTWGVNTYAITTVLLCFIVILQTISICQVVSGRFIIYSKITFIYIHLISSICTSTKCGKGQRCEYLWKPKYAYNDTTINKRILHFFIYPSDSVNGLMFARYQGPFTTGTWIMLQKGGEKSGGRLADLANK